MDMKKVIVFSMIALLLSMSYVPLSYAGHHGGGYAVGALAGGLLLGTFIGSALSQPHYVAPAPVYVYPARAPAYAYPSGPAEGPPGQWVVVPGQWVGGAWVPSHRVWTPTSPY
jgi:hypothetical protein